MTDMTDASSERMMTPELMITGEAVALEIIPASVGLRHHYVLSSLLNLNVLKIQSDRHPEAVHQGRAQIRVGFS